MFEGRVGFITPAGCFWKTGLIDIEHFGRAVFSSISFAETK